MTEPSAVDRWAPRSIDQLLEEFTALSYRMARGEAVHRPLLTVHLRSGRELDGYLHSVHDARNGGRTLLLHLPGPDRFPNQDVAHVPVSHIEALTVRDVGAFDAPAPGAPPPPTRLELRRRLAATEAALKDKLGHALALKAELPEDPRALGALAAVDALLLSLFGELAASELGREAVKKLSAVSLVLQDSAEVTLSGSVLAIGVSAAHGGRYTATSLQAAIEKVL